MRTLKTDFFRFSFCSWAHFSTHGWIKGQPWLLYNICLKYMPTNYYSMTYCTFNQAYHIFVPLTKWIVYYAVSMSTQIKPWQMTASTKKVYCHCQTLCKFNFFLPYTPYTPLFFFFCFFSLFYFSSLLLLYTHTKLTCSLGLTLAVYSHTTDSLLGSTHELSNTSSGTPTHTTWVMTPQALTVDPLL